MWKAFVAVCLCFSVACPASNAQPLPAEEVQPSADSHLYDREQFTVVMTHTGAISGTTTIYVRDWGRHQAMINDTTLTIGERTERTRNRIVTDGVRTITIEETGAISGMTDRDYNERLAQWRGLSAEERIEQQLTEGGMQRTGEMGVFAGQSCAYWINASIGIRTCLAPWGFFLYSSNSIANVHNVTATELRVGDGGPDAAFAYDPSTVVDRPVVPPDAFPALDCAQHGSVLQCSEKAH